MFYRNTKFESEKNTKMSFIIWESCISLQTELELLNLKTGISTIFVTI